MELSATIGQPLQRTKRLTTSREFVRWQRWLNDRAYADEKIDWYLAQIAMEVRRAASDSGTFRIKDYLLDFEPEAEKDPEASRIESMMFWEHLIFSGSDKNPPIHDEQ